MRVFWVIVAVLVIVGVGIPVVRGIQARSHAEAAAQQAVAREVEARAQAERELAKAQAAAKVAEEKAASTAAEKAKTATPLPPAEAKPSEAKPAEAKPAETPTAVTPPLEPAPAKPETPEATEIKPAAAPVEPSKAPVPTPAAPPTPPAAAASGVAASNPAVDATKATEAAGPKIVKRDDGTMLVDDKFVVKGEGTKEKPYEVSWDMLVSAQESYEPRQGKKKLPDRLTMLNDKYVKLTGYVAYPMFVEQPRELLSMLNQWDGCCIGVPPTPYDAVEVHLAEPVDKEQRAGIYGVVTGKFGVKPYLAGDWLVGLYLMENASYESKGFGGN